MRRRPAHLVVSALAYAGFAGVLGWTVLFLAGVVVPRTVDAPVRTGAAVAVAVDVALLLLFAVQHSVMARRPVKRALARVVPRAVERATFVLATVFCLVLLLAFWQPVDGWLWRVDGPVATLLWVGYLAGWALALTATFAVDHLDFIGLRQAGWRTPSDGYRPPTFVESGLYALVRHPMMVGLLIAFWCTPRMSAGHLLFAVAASGYVVVGIRLEERDLRREIGPAYDRYAEQVPALVPRARRPRSAPSGAGADPT